jgi:hypothetical protein
MVSPLQKDWRLRVFDNRMLIRAFETKRDEKLEKNA